MHPACKAAINAVAGKPLTGKQLQAIEDQMSAAMRSLARLDPAAWQSMTRDQQLTAGAKSVMENIREAAKRKLENAQRQILKVADTEQRVAALQDSFKDTPGHSGSRAEALKRDFDLAHQQITAERKMAMGGLMDLITAAGDKKGVGLGRKFLMTFFDAENPVMTRDIVREIFQNAAGLTKNAVATAGARAWLDTIEKLRTRFNAAGGDVGKLDYGYAPQPHDTARIRKAGAATWADKVLPLLDRKRYLRDDGSLMDDAEVRNMLLKAHETLATEGLNKTAPGEFQGSGNRANKGSDSRQIHFADGDAWVAYMDEFGKGSIYDAMMAHIGGLVRDTGLIERYGPDAAGNARLQLDLVKREDAPSKMDALRTDPQTYWDMISGKVGTPKNETLANTFSMLRSLQVAAKLGGAVISSVTDLGTLAITTGYNRLPYWRMIQDIGSQASKDTRDFMSTHGMVAESVADSLNRWSGDNLGTNWSGKVASSVLRLSLLNHWTDGLRQGFTLSMNAGMARMAKKAWGALDEFDRSRLTRAGITEADWAVLQNVAPTNFKGRELLTPQAIKQSGHADADAVAAKVFGFIHDESEFAVVNPDLETRARITFGGTQAGTGAGEIARTIMQFKSFPVAMITRHWNRMLEGGHGADGGPMLANRTAYGMALLATLTGLGAVATQEKQILQGKDPIDMSKPRFWMKALAQGGGFGIAGDLFLIDPASSATDSATTAIKNLAGPTIGTVADMVLKNVTENVWQAAEGKTTHWEAELVNWAKAQTPGGNLWWMKPLVDHGFVNAMNESMSPGYLARQQQRAAKEWGQRYWWRPQDTTPQRAPDMAAALP
jgi:hypothetical protein